MKLRILFIAGAIAASAHASAQQAIVPMEGPTLRAPRLTQFDVTSGQYSLLELRLKGFEMFCTPFNRFDGYGDGLVDPADPISPGGRPTTSAGWLRANGLDAQSCFECHGIVSNLMIPPRFGVGGAGAIAATSFPGLTHCDIPDNNANGVAENNGRMINPVALFGSGGVELLAKEMTSELQSLKVKARTFPGLNVELVTHGVNFGTIRYIEATEDFETSNVVGIEPDLVVRPFGRKGEFSSIRDFAIGAFEMHFGMQPAEVVGRDMDPDGDNVVNEVFPGELSAIHIYLANLERPREMHDDRPAVQRGRQVFMEMGCAACHIPEMRTVNTSLPISFPEVPTDPCENIYMRIDLVNGSAGFEPDGEGGILVPLFSDLKRHDMGPELAETAGVPLDPYFITAKLWGVAGSAPYLHDGRAMTLREAIEMHGGEAAPAAAAFAATTPQDQENLLIFLRTLRAPAKPNADLQP